MGLQSADSAYLTLAPLRDGPLPLPPRKGGEGNLVFEVVEQRLRGLQIRGVEAFGKPAEDWGEQGGRLLRPARLHVRIEQLEALPIVRKRRLDLPLVEQRRTECHVPADGAGRVAKPFGDTQRLLSKMLRLLHLE